MRFLLRPNIIRRAFSHHPTTTKLPDFIYNNNNNNNENASKNDIEIINNNVKLLSEKTVNMQDEIKKMNNLIGIHFIIINSVYLTVFLLIV